MTLLEVTGLNVSYGTTQVVHDLDLAVESGKILTVLGPNGAGKSSTLRAVCGLIRRTPGEVRLEGRSIGRLRASQVASAGLVMVPEGRRVFGSLSVEENLLLGAYRLGRRRKQQTLDTCYDMFPILQQRRAQRAGYLSGGEQQMLAFGRALMADPLVILMDEPSMGLAPVVVNQVMAHARVIADLGIGVLMVEQNARAAMKVADEVVVLRLGRPVFRGSVEQARGDAALVRAFLGDTAVAEPSGAEPSGVAPSGAEPRPASPRHAVPDVVS
ncbi:ABC transporter ATP-binding protein [Pseudonocardia ailaonensis]|uniref:ABC transporter ATP-binding protein n=1 Tax=Pseudonocardia ailaonensis TaxID=367279 RepID=A0ABN2NH81_9PSEU